MNTKIIKITDISRDSAKIEQVSDILKDGGLAVLPTETVYGIAANALDSDAVLSIFKAKGRPSDNPLIVHVASLDEIAPLVTDFPDAAKALASQFWPGPLTIILTKSQAVPSAVSGGLSTVAIRMPSHPIIRSVIIRSGLPLAAPSANISGRPSPTTARHCVDDLNGKVNVIVDGGDCEVGLESTVISLVSPVPRLLRPGIITLDELSDVLGAVETDPAVTAKISGNAKVSSPGMKYRHYAPNIKLTLIHGDFGEFARYVAQKPGAAALVFDGEEKRLTVRCVTYGAKKNPAEQARRLFSALRELDETGAQRAFARVPDISGAGLAVYNRLARAAAFDEIYL